MKGNLLVVDFGYSFIKALYNGKKLKEPSYFSIDYESMKNNVLVQSSNGSTYIFENTPISVGEDASNKKMKRFSREIEFIIRHYPLVIYHVMRKMHVNPNNLSAVVIGLPPENMQKELIEQLKKHIVSTPINNEKLKINKNKIIVVGQGQGAFIDYKSTNGNESKNGFLVDIGFNTLIAIPFKNGKILPHFKQYERFGISGLLENFLNPILQVNKNIRLKNLQELNKAFLKGKIFKDFGTYEDIIPEIKQAVSNYLEIVLQTLKEDFYEDIKSIEKFVLTGGGSYRLKEFIPQNLKQITFIPEEPDFSNARGFLKIASAVLSSN